MKMKNKTLSMALTCGVLLMNACMGIAYADDQGNTDDANIGLRPSYQQCLDDSGGVTSKLLDCNGDELKYQDKRLNTAYKAVVKSLSPNDVSQLRAEERQWITSRDSDCAPDPNGGTASTVDASGCKVEHTAKRARELEARLQK
jgi:uncharacterized protein YecT (DUF1311 family)